MPELPEVETVVRGLRQHLPGKIVSAVRVMDYRAVRPDDPAGFESRLKGARFLDVVRKGKYLHFRLDTVQMVSHLRMTGKFVFLDAMEDYGSHVRLEIILSGGAVLLFQDTRRFGTNRVYGIEKQPPEFERLGIDPFVKEFTPQYMLKSAMGRSIPIKQFLLDQRIVAGLGNIYVCEILFAAGIHPEKKASSVVCREWEQCVRETRRILTSAIHSNGTTIRDFRAVDDKNGEFQNFLQVYGREGEACRRCGASVERITLAGRSSWFCPECQSG